MKITLRKLRKLIHEAMYDATPKQIAMMFPDELEDAVEYVMCRNKINDKSNAQTYISSNWNFDTIEDGDRTILIARDEDSGEAFAYVEKMGGWYNRMGNNNTNCRQTDATNAPVPAKSKQQKQPSREDMDLTRA